MTPAHYSVSGLVGAPTGGSGAGGADVAQASYGVGSVHTATLVDSWASIVE